MKTCKGLQIGNLLRVIETGKVIKINSITRKKVGYREGTTEKYLRLHCVNPIEVTDEMLDKLFVRHEVMKMSSYGVPNVDWESEDNKIIIRPMANRMDCNYCVHVDNDDMDSVVYGDFKYLHELQNLVENQGEYITKHIIDTLWQN